MIKLKRFLKLILGIGTICLIGVYSLSYLYASEISTDIQNVITMPNTNTVNDIQSISCGVETQIQDKFLIITPLNEINTGTKIEITYTNAYIKDIIQYESTDKQYNWISAINLYKNTNAKEIVYINLFEKDNKLPYKINKKSSNKIEVELFPVDERYCNKPFYHLNGNNLGVAKYFIPLNAIALGNGDVCIDVNGLDTSVESSKNIIAVTGEIPEIKEILNNNITITKISSVNKGKVIKNSYLKITPEEPIKMGSTVILKINNAKFLEPEQYFSTNKLYTWNTAIELCSNGIAEVENLIKLMSSDNKLPYNITKKSDSEIEIELYPISEKCCNKSFYDLNGIDLGLPTYFIPLNMVGLNDDNIYIELNGNNIFENMTGIVGMKEIYYGNGDIDDDGVLSANDASVLLMYIKDLVMLNDKQLVESDVNGDSIIDENDAILILDMVFYN